MSLYARRFRYAVSHAPQAVDWKTLHHPGSLFCVLSFPKRGRAVLKPQYNFMINIIQEYIYQCLLAILHRLVLGWLRPRTCDSQGFTILAYWLPSTTLPVEILHSAYTAQTYPCLFRSTCITGKRHSINQDQINRKGHNAYRFLLLSYMFDSGATLTLHLLVLHSC